MCGSSWVALHCPVNIAVYNVAFSNFSAQKEILPGKFSSGAYKLRFGTVHVLVHPYSFR
jgi:hypothetical protein